MCVDRLGEKVGSSRVDRFGVKVVLENLPGGHWNDRHNTMEQEVAALCAYAGIPAEREPFGLFGHLLPQQALSRLQQHQLSAKFLIADDYRSDPSYSFPFSKSDDVANERAEVQIHEHLFNHSNIGVVTGSNKDKSKKYETTNNNTTKRLGEVDYTKAESFKTTATKT